MCNLLLFIKSAEYILSLSELLSSHAASTAFNSPLSIRLHNHSITMAWQRSNWFQMFLVDQFLSEYSAGDPVFSTECLVLLGLLMGPWVLISKISSSPCSYFCLTLHRHVPKEMLLRCSGVNHCNNVHTVPSLEQPLARVITAPVHFTAH